MQLAADAARQSVTLLKNTAGALPWAPAGLAGKRVCAFGPLANLSVAHMGSYAPTVPIGDMVSPAAGLQAALEAVGATVVTLAGCTDQTACTQLDPALGPLAATCDAIVAVLGTSAVTSEEEALPSRRQAQSSACDPTQNAHEQEGCDRANVLLPGMQLALLATLTSAANKSGAPLVLVAVSAGMLDLSVPAADPTVAAILRAPYLAQFVGTALADVIMGSYNPSGRLTVTFYAPPYSNALPAMTNYSMAGRTYRYYDGEPLYEFGFGLSYTTWGYTDITTPQRVGPCDTVMVSTVLSNTGLRSGAEVPQLYLSIINATVPLVPRLQLVNFDKVSLEPGSSAQLNFSITPEDSSVLREGDYVPVIEPGIRSVWLGSSSGTMRPGVAASYEVVGPVTPLSACTGASMDRDRASARTSSGMKSPAHVWSAPKLNTDRLDGAARWDPRST